MNPPPRASISAPIMRGPSGPIGDFALEIKLRFSGTINEALFPTRHRLDGRLLARALFSPLQNSSRTRHSTVIWALPTAFDPGPDTDRLGLNCHVPPVLRTPGSVLGSKLRRELPPSLTPFSRQRHGGEFRLVRIPSLLQSAVRTKRWHQPDMEYGSQRHHFNPRPGTWDEVARCSAR